jgi:acetolactate synthase II small subunit
MSHVQAHEISFVLEHREGALLRALGTIERRGFFTLAVDAQPGPADTLDVVVRIAAHGSRCALVLRRQLLKLHDVRAVTLSPDTTTVAGPMESVAC